MYFVTWTVVNGDYFDTVRFSDCLQKFTSQCSNCYLLLGIVGVDFHFPTITITKMAEMLSIADPRHSNIKRRDIMRNKGSRKLSA